MLLSENWIATAGLASAGAGFFESTALVFVDSLFRSIQCAGGGGAGFSTSAILEAIPENAVDSGELVTLGIHPAGGGGAAFSTSAISDHVTNKR